MYTQNKGKAFSCANFHETQKCQRVSCVERLYRISHKSENEVENADINSFICLSKYGFHGADFREIYSNSITFVDISYSGFYRNWTKILENADQVLFKPFSKLRVSLHQFFTKLSGT
jgi:hypothetical protein